MYQDKGHCQYTTHTPPLRHMKVWEWEHGLIACSLLELKRQQWWTIEQYLHCVDMSKVKWFYLSFQLVRRLPMIFTIACHSSFRRQCFCWHLMRIKIDAGFFLWSNFNFYCFFFPQFWEYKINLKNKKHNEFAIENHIYTNKTLKLRK